MRLTKMNEEQADKMIKIMEELLDYTKGLHKEMREVKVRISEMGQ